MTKKPSKSATIRKMTKKQHRSVIRSQFPDYPSQARIDAFFAQVGKTIGIWQLVEANLYQVYRALTKAQVPGAEAAAFFGLGIFSAQLNMVEAAALFVLHNDKTKRKVWADLLKEARAKARLRNEIAHGVVYVEYQQPNKETQVHLGPHMSDAGKALGKPHPFTRKLLKQYQAEFLSLAQGLLAFAQSLP